MNARDLRQALSDPRHRGCECCRPRGNVHCPSHGGASLHVSQKGPRLLVHCFGGCAKYDVIKALIDRGLWGPGERQSQTTVCPTQAEVVVDPGYQRRALAIWEQAQPIPGTIAETYLRHRGITCDLPPSLRFAPRCRYSGKGPMPAMVAAVEHVVRGVTGIHRTYLASDGLGKAAVDPAKKMLGPTAGGAVRLAEAGPELIVAEGIETALSVQQETGLPAWAALSTSGIEALVLPSSVAKVVIAADGDVAGELCARRAAARWTAEGRDVRIARPPAGQDFNDLVMTHG